MSILFHVMFLYSGNGWRSFIEGRAETLSALPDGLFNIINVEFDPWFDNVVSELR